MKLQSIIFASLATICVAFTTGASHLFNVKEYRLKGNPQVYIIFSEPLEYGYLWAKNMYCTAIKSEPVTQHFIPNTPIPETGVFLGGVQVIDIKCLNTGDEDGWIGIYNSKSDPAILSTTRNIVARYEALTRLMQIPHNMKAYQLDGNSVIDVKFTGYVEMGYISIENMECKIILMDTLISGSSPNSRFYNEFISFRGVKYLRFDCEYKPNIEEGDENGWITVYTPVGGPWIIQVTDSRAYLRASRQRNIPITV